MCTQSHLATHTYAEIHRQPDKRIDKETDRQTETDSQHQQLTKIIDLTIKKF